MQSQNKKRRKIDKSNLHKYTLIKEAEKQINDQNIEMFLDDFIENIEKDDEFFGYLDSETIVFNLEIYAKLEFIKNHIMKRFEFVVKIEQDCQIEIFSDMNDDCFGKILKLQFIFFNKYYTDYINEFKEFLSENGDISNFPSPSLEKVMIFPKEIENIMNFLENFYIHIDEYKDTWNKVEEILINIKTKIMKKEKDKEKILEIKNCIDNMKINIAYYSYIRNEEYLQYKESIDENSRNFEFVDEGMKLLFNKLSQIFSCDSEGKKSIARILITPANEEKRIYNNSDLTVERKKICLYSKLSNFELLKKILNLQCDLIEGCIKVVRNYYESNSEITINKEINLNEILFIPFALSEKINLNKINCVERTILI
jgi:hypothetical protein